MDNTEPNPVKSPIGDLWKIYHGDKIHITNQKGVEEYLRKHNEEKKRNKGLCEVL